MKEEYEYNRRIKERQKIPQGIGKIQTGGEKERRKRIEGELFTFEDLNMEEEKNEEEEEYTYFNPMAPYLGNYFEAATKMIKEDYTLSPLLESSRMKAVSPIQLETTKMTFKRETEKQIQEQQEKRITTTTTTTKYKHIANKLLNTTQQSYQPEEKIQLFEEFYYYNNNNNNNNNRQQQSITQQQQQQQYTQIPPPQLVQNYNQQIYQQQQYVNIPRISVGTPPPPPQQQQQQQLQQHVIQQLQQQQQETTRTLASQRLISSDEAKKQCKVNKRGVPTRGTTIITTNGFKGTWTEEEHNKFMEGLSRYERGKWKEIAELVGTRTRVQVASHAQKYFRKIERRASILKKRRARAIAAEEKKRQKRAERERKRKQKQQQKKQNQRVEVETPQGYFSPFSAFFNTHDE